MRQWLWGDRDAPALRKRGAVLAAQLASAIAFVAPFRRTNGFPLDDAWIHQVVARTFATTGTLGYRPGAFGSGATSDLWAVLLAVGQLVHASPVVFTDVLGVLAALAAGQALLVLVAAPARVPTWPETAAVAIAASCGDFTWHAFSGMESTLVVALGLGALACVAGDAPSPRALSAAGILAGLAALARPDTIVLGVAVVALVFLRETRERSAKPSRAAVAALRVAVPWGAACALYFGANVAFTGKLLPATLRGRRWLWLDSTDPTASALALAQSFAEAWADRLRYFTLGAGGVLLLWATLGLVAASIVAAARTGRRGVLLAAAWCALHVAVFAVILPVPGHGGRYQPLLPSLWLLLATLGAIDLARSIVRRARAESDARLEAGASALVLVGAAACVGGAWLGWRDAHGNAVAHIARTEIAAGRAVHDLPAEARIASFDVGAIGYFGERPLLDLGALSDPSVVRYLQRDAIVELLREHRVDHVVLPDGLEPNYPDMSNFAFRLGLSDNPAIALETTQTFAGADPAAWLDGVWYTQNATFRQVVDEVRFTTCREPPVKTDGPRPALEGFALSVPARNRLLFNLEAAAARGLCVRIAATGEPSRADGCWSIRLATPDAPLVAAPADAADAEAAAATAVHDAVAPYLAVGNPTGAAAASLHALARVVRQRVSPCFWARLPALEEPAAPEAPAPTPASTTWWGFPLAIAVAALASILRASAGRVRA